MDRLYQETGVYPRFFAIPLLLPPSQLGYHLRHPRLPHVGVHRGGVDALVAEQGLDVYPFRASIEQVGGLSTAQLVGSDGLGEVRPLPQPAEVGSRRLRGGRFPAGVMGWSVGFRLRNRRG